MIFSKLLALMSLLAPIVAKSLTICVPSAEGAEVETIKTLYNSFCDKLDKKNFGADTLTNALPVISLNFTTSGTDKCDLDNCHSSYATLLSTCKFSLLSSL